jgi:hypothetical protein
MERVFAPKAGHVPSIPNLSPAELNSLRQIFDSHGYAGDNLSRDGGAPDILGKLFTHNEAVDFDIAAQTFRPLELDKLIGSGLLYEANGNIKTHFQAQPYQGLIFFSDFFQWESAHDLSSQLGLRDIISRF